MTKMIEKLQNNEGVTLKKGKTVIYKPAIKSPLKGPKLRLRPKLPK